MCAFGNCRNEFLVIINGYVEFNPTVRGLSFSLLSKMGLGQVRLSCKDKYLLSPSKLAEFLSMIIEFALHLTSMVILQTLQQASVKKK